jgi:hypothetical protein
LSRRAHSRSRSASRAGEPGSGEGGFTGRAAFGRVARAPSLSAAGGGFWGEPAEGGEGARARAGSGAGALPPPRRRGGSVVGLQADAEVEPLVKIEARCPACAAAAV